MCVAAPTGLVGVEDVERVVHRAGGHQLHGQLFMKLYLPGSRPTAATHGQQEEVGAVLRRGAEDFGKSQVIAYPDAEDPAPAGDDRKSIPSDKPRLLAGIGQMQLGVGGQMARRPDDQRTIGKTATGRFDGPDNHRHIQFTAQGLETR